MVTWRLGLLHLVALRACLENNAQESAAAADELLAGPFSDPEGWSIWPASWLV